MPLSQSQLLYLDHLEDHYDKTGEYPKTIRAQHINQQFLDALKFRGLPPPNTSSLDRITPTQRAVIRLLTDITDKRPIRTKLQSVGVTSQEYNKWRRNPKFQEQLNDYINKTFQDISQDSKLVISQLIINGDLQAIKYYHELTGQAPKYQQDQTNVNLTIILAKLMEILVRHLEPELLSHIADEIERTVFQSNTKNQTVVLHSNSSDAVTDIGDDQLALQSSSISKQHTITVETPDSKYITVETPEGPLNLSF